MIHINTFLYVRLYSINCSSFWWIFFYYQSTCQTVYIFLNLSTVLVNVVDRVSSKVTIESFTHVIFSELQRIIVDLVSELNSMSSNSNHGPRLTAARITKYNSKITRTKTTLNAIIKNRPRGRNSRAIINPITSFNIFVIFMSNIFIHTSFHCFLYHISDAIKVTFFK